MTANIGCSYDITTEPNRGDANHMAVSC